MSIQATDADPLTRLPLGDRPAYATGMLLDAQDFDDEQTYHRSRLARALASLSGGGTLAGLAVSWQAQAVDHPEEIRVGPGIAIDRLGRLVELPRPACVRLQPWLDDTLKADGGDTVLRACVDNPAPLVSARLQAAAAAPGAEALPTRALLADVYIRFVACPVGLTPAFARGPFDALNAVATARLRDAWELQLVARTDLDAARPGLPLPALASLPDGSDAATRQAALQDAVLDAYVPRERVTDGSPGLSPGLEHQNGIDPSAVWLARVLLPVQAGAPLQRVKDQSVRVDNHARRFLPTLALLGQACGL
jgi:hypothetical protein